MNTIGQKQPSGFEIIAQINEYRTKSDALKRRISSLYKNLSEHPTSKQKSMKIERLINYQSAMVSYDAEIKRLNESLSRQSIQETNKRKISEIKIEETPLEKSRKLLSVVISESQPQIEMQPFCGMLEPGGKFGDDITENEEEQDSLILALNGSSADPLPFI